jgi:magnesium transporter
VKQLSPSYMLSQLDINPGSIDSAAPLLNRVSPIELADFIAEQNRNKQLLLFNALTPDKAVATFPYLPFKVQQRFVQAVPTEREATLLDALSPDDRTALLEELPSDVVNSLLKHLSPEERALSIKLLGYPKNSVGRLMTPDYIAIQITWTVREVLDYIRLHGHDSETLNVIYAVDDMGVLVDDFRIRELLLSPLDTPMEELADHKFVFLHVDDCEEVAINIFRKYFRTVLPVIDHKGVLLGIVTVDDILALSTEENTEDMQKIGGVLALKEPYLEVPFLSLMYKRIGWLQILFLGELLTASAMGYYEDSISKAVVLALFLPLIISSGGNAGSQASTLVVRALALGEVTFRDLWRILRREIFSGLFLGTALGITGFLRVALWGKLFGIYGEHWLLVAFTIFLSLIGVVAWGSISGAMLPLLLNRCGFDAATSSTPFVATLVDVTGLIIYFNIALIVLRGTLL